VSLQRVQLATLFQLLKDGRPMLEFENRFNIYEFLNVPDLPRVHWNDGAGWLMACHMYDIVKQKHRSMLAAAQYISLIADETSANDNCSYIVVHAYLLQNWVRVPLILHLQKLESSISLASFLFGVFNLSLYCALLVLVYVILVD
jgi:hypothetical protein